MRTRLPRRIDPLPGEWWRGYIHRVSATYEMPEFVLPRWLTDTHGPYRRYERRSGVAVTDATAARLASQLNLTAHEVHSMHLSAYDGSALAFDEAGALPFDPSLTPDVDRKQLEALGPLAKVTQDRYCPACVLEVPGYRAMSWRLLVHLVCVRHHVLLIDGTPTTGASGNTSISDAVVSAQTVVLSHLEPSVESAAFFAHLEAQLKPAQRRGWAVYARQAREMPLAAARTSALPFTESDPAAIPTTRV